MSNKKPILLIEDEEVDVMRVKRSLKDINIQNPLVVAGNGKEGLEYLENKNNLIPALILLDVIMPIMDGMEFLKIIKENKKFKDIPIIMLTSSKDEKNWVESLKLNVHGFLYKSEEYKDFVDTLKAIEYVLIN
ncbi:MAG: response regulator [Spirochaetota bacterium]|nr:response regulator [Spirochaetota bacterium]